MAPSPPIASLCSLLAKRFGKWQICQIKLPEFCWRMRKHKATAIGKDQCTVKYVLDTE